MKLLFRDMARFAYLKSCYERFRRTFSHITQVIAQDSINDYLKRSIEIASNTGGMRL